MSTAALDCVNILRLHTDDEGVVWFGDDYQLAINSETRASDFFESDALGIELKHVRKVRLLGTRANAPLIVRLAQTRCRDHNVQIQLGSPALVPTRAARGDPTTVLQYLWQPSYSSTCPGMWHAFAEHDFPGYLMLSELREKQAACLGVGSFQEVPDVVKRTARYHPAWPAVTFVPWLDHNWACRLLCEIIDPRWFIHPQRPDRPSRLFNHLGLTPRNMGAFLQQGFPDPHYYQATTALRCWYNRGMPQSRSGPGSFLWRAYLSTDNQVKGLLRGTQQLVRLIQSVWLQTVVRPHPEFRFQPIKFFKDPAEAEAFEQHRASCKPVE